MIIKNPPKKAHADFLAARWAAATSREKELLAVLSHLHLADAGSGFTVREVVEESARRLERPFSPEHASFTLSKLRYAGLIYENRHGEHSFTASRMARYFLRQASTSEAVSS